MKKILSMVVVFILSMFVITSCSTPSESLNKKDNETYTVTDQLGRAVKVPKKVEKVVCLQHHTLDIMLEMGAGDKLVGVVENWESLLGSYIKKVYPKLESLPTPGGLESINIESVLALKPDVVFFAHQLPKSYIEKLEEAGIPSIGISLYKADKEQASTINPDLVNPDEAYTVGMKEAINLIGKVIGKEDRAIDLVSSIEKNREVVKNNIETIPKDKRIKVYIANPDMYTYGTGKYVGCAIEKAGGYNVAQSLKGYKQAKIEDVIKWDPEFIFVQSRSKNVLDEIKNDSAWKDISAVKNNKLIVAPDYVKPWGHPCPESMALGEIWLAKTLYPEKFKDVDLNKLVQEFYTKFYGIDYNE